MGPLYENLSEPNWPFAEFESARHRVQIGGPDQIPKCVYRAYAYVA
jgi:hypothetical protein